MSVPVRVDLNSAVVTYRPAVGEERSVAAWEATPKGLFEGYPWRTFRSHDGQKHYSGAYWSSTVGDHVIYESRLELPNLVAADFDPRVQSDDSGVRHGFRLGPPGRRPSRPRVVTWFGDDRLVVPQRFPAIIRGCRSAAVLGATVDRSASNSLVQQANSSMMPSGS